MRTRWFILTVGMGIVIVLFAFPLWWPVVNRSPISDALPGLDDLPPAEQDVVEEIALQDMAFAAALIETGLAEPDIVPEAERAMPSMQGASLLRTGEFVEIDAVRWARGRADVYQQADGSWVIRLEDFEVRNGPQLHLFLSAHPAPRTPEEVREGNLGFDWGPIKGSVGSQNFMLPAGFNMDAVSSIVIYSVTFQEVFSSATLS